MTHEVTILLVHGLQRPNSSLLRGRCFSRTTIMIWSAVLRAIQRQKLITCGRRRGLALDALSAERELECGILPNKGTMQSTKIWQNISRVRTNQSFDERGSTTRVRIANGGIDVGEQIDAEMQGEQLSIVCVGFIWVAVDFWWR